MPPKKKINFEKNGLYVIVSRQLLSPLLHWGLYLHLDHELGCVFHIRNKSDDPTWHFEYKTSTNVVVSQTIVFALRVAVVKPEIMHTALQSFLPTVSMEDPNQYGQLTCQTWVMQALYEMDQGGYISIIPGYTVRDVVAEADEAAKLNAEAQGVPSAEIPDEDLLRDSAFSNP